MKQIYSDTDSRCTNLARFNDYLTKLPSQERFNNSLEQLWDRFNKEEGNELP